MSDKSMGCWHGCPEPLSQRFWPWDKPGFSKRGVIMKSVSGPYTRLLKALILAYGSALLLACGGGGNTGVAPVGVNPPVAVTAPPVFLMAANNGMTGMELFATNGTAAGTRLVKD
jgi:hypothetical protein